MAAVGQVDLPQPQSRLHLNINRRSLGRSGRETALRSCRRKAQRRRRVENDPPPLWVPAVLPRYARKSARRRARDQGGPMTDTKIEVQGTCDEQFEAVREAFYKNLDEGKDIGASVTVHVEGEPVVDLWGGWTDEERTTAWERDTITNVWSTSKTL